MFLRFLEYNKITEDGDCILTLEFDRFFSPISLVTSQEDAVGTRFARMTDTSDRFFRLGITTAYFRMTMIGVDKWIGRGTVLYFFTSSQ